VSSHAPTLGPSEALELALLEHPQQLDLRREVDVADLVEEQRAALRQLEPPLLARLRARERALLVPEELRLDQRVRQRRAADLEKRLLGARGAVMDGVGDELLARPRFAADGHRGVGPRHPRDLLVHLAHRPARADDAREVVALAEFLAQVRVLVDQALPLGVHEPLHPDGLPHHRRHQAQHTHELVVVALPCERQVHRQRAHRLSVDDNRHAQKTDLAPIDLVARQPIAEERLAADLGHDDGLAALDDTGREAVRQPIPYGGPIGLYPVGGVRVQLPGGVDERDGPAHEPVMTPEHLEHPYEPRLERERSGERLRDFGERHRLPHARALGRVLGIGRRGAHGG
jgi:hypothetical protein